MLNSVWYGWAENRVFYCFFPIAQVRMHDVFLGSLVRRDIAFKHSTAKARREYRPFRYVGMYLIFSRLYSPPCPTKQAYTVLHVTHVILSASLPKSFDGAQ